MPIAPHLVEPSGSSVYRRSAHAPVLRNSTSVAAGSETAEIDTSQADFRSADEAIGYARRLAEELFELAEQLTLDFDYTQVAVYEGQADPPELDIHDPGFVGMWMFVDEGVAWVDAQAFRSEAMDEPITH